MPSVYDWSLTSSSNSNADSGINWAEGQAPSTVNNSARVMMSRIKALLNDLGGVPVATGTANSITISASSGFADLADGRRISFRAANTNTAATTLSVNGIGSKPAVKFTASGEATFTGGEIQTNGIYEAIYCSILNGSDGAWLVLNPTQETEAAGVIKALGGTIIPSGYLSCNGAAISRTTYARLFTAIGTAWGVGDGLTTFNLPDLRDDFLRGASSTLTVGTKQTDDFKGHTHTGTTSSNGSHNHDITIGVDNGGPLNRVQGTSNTSSGSASTSTDGAHTHTFTTVSTGGTETRPRNGVVLFVIKT